jgi:hypothetical protein
MIEKAVGGPDTISAHAQSADCTPETAVFEHSASADDHAGVEHLIDDDHGPMAWGKAID